MRTTPVLLALLGALAAAPAQAQAPDPVADSIVRNLTRGLRIPGQGDAVTAPVTPLDPRSPVQAGTTAPPDRPAVSLMITFATGSAQLTPQAEAVLGSLARALATPELAGSRFRIEGHTDTVGDAGLNQALSERRAAMVRDVLVQRYGIAATRLDPRGFGESTLLVPTGDGRAEPRNRRVQVVNLGD
ncbi:OmpA family protein [Roseomonas sp. CECT 9278]|uniref:OmpA family protein n=1 Tax=Roseomonas sp. CECT 9278 TaxID=2845823 RepID=UPI001E5B3FCF|nr:OmpA family protein [Roseomonas sp. CECT 9278]CAH0262952.1 Outer membrane porin F [Roseomonas sp. CECT 9278]